jgi:hypothetical protein
MERTSPQRNLSPNYTEVRKDKNKTHFNIQSETRQNPDRLSIQNQANLKPALTYPNLRWPDSHPLKLKPAQI